MSIKIINFENKVKDIERSVNPGKNRKLPNNRPKIDLENILNNMEKKDDKKVLFSDVVEVAQYEKPPELIPNLSPLKSNKSSVIDLLNLKSEKTSRSPSPNTKKKQHEITEYFKKEIETLDTKLGKRTRSPSPIRCSSPVKNYYKSNFDRKVSPEKIKKFKNKVKILLDINWFKERPTLVYNQKIKNKIEKKIKISKIPYEDALILYSVLGF